MKLLSALLATEKPYITTTYIDQHDDDKDGADAQCSLCLACICLRQICACSVFVYCTCTVHTGWVSNFDSVDDNKLI